jgi:hypothetical protein
MRVKVTFVNGGTMHGRLSGDDEVYATLPPKDVIPWVMNDPRSFIPFTQPSGIEIHLNKSNIAYIVLDEED